MTCSLELGSYSYDSVRSIQLFIIWNIFERGDYELFMSYVTIFKLITLRIYTSKLWNTPLPINCCKQNLIIQHNTLQCTNLLNVEGLQTTVRKFQLLPALFWHTILYCWWSKRGNIKEATNNSLLKVCRFK